MMKPKERRSTVGKIAAVKHNGGDDIDRMYEAVRWYSDFCDTNNSAFVPLFFDRHRFLVMMGGGGSGKSIFAGRKLLQRCVDEPGHRVLVCRKVQKTLRQSCFKQLRSQLRQHYADASWHENMTDMSINFDNGSEIIFAGLDDVEKLKSIYNIDMIWIEEASEILESDFDQLNIRMRGTPPCGGDGIPYYKQIIITFNPISVMHWLKRRFFDRCDPRARVHRSTYRDNRFLPPEDRVTLEDFKNTDEYYYMVYCLGMWGVTGKTVFDGRAVSERIDKMSRTHPLRTGYFDYDYDGIAITNWRFVDDPKGFINIYRDRSDGVPYVIGGDTAGGGSDSFVAQVLDNTDGAQAATLRTSTDEDLFARQVYCLGRYYNYALCGIEANYSTYPVMELERLRYRRQYVRETIDDFTHDVRRSFGFQTNLKTRPVIIAGLIRWARENIDSISDMDTLSEMLTFVRNDEFRAEAEEGAHDDCIMSLAIAHYIRPHQAYSAAPEALPEKIWSADMWQDWRSADATGRAMLRQKWGEPRR